MSEHAIEIDVHSLKNLLDDNAEFFLLDCREQTEYDMAHIEGSTLIPMSEIQYRLEELEAYRDQPLVVHCHLGGRSLQVTNFLRQMGFSKACNLAGGIDEWSTSIDPNVPRYS